MKPIAGIEADRAGKIEYILTDIDDTLTSDGILPASAYAALEDLKKSGRRVAPITGRPAGWCDHIARMWPVDAVVGENGAFYFHYDRANRKMLRRFWKTADERREDRGKLERIRDEILEKVPGCAVAADQAYREADLAIDFREDVAPLEFDDVLRIVEIFEEHGAKAKISSIHVNGWFGDYDKLAMTDKMFAELFGEDLEKIKDRVLFAGDSPNDEPMFRYFPESAGVANVADFAGVLKAEPTWIASTRGGDGFAEIAGALLRK